MKNPKTMQWAENDDDNKDDEDPSNPSDHANPSNLDDHTNQENNTDNTNHQHNITDQNNQQDPTNNVDQTDDTNIDSQSNPTNQIGNQQERQADQEPAWTHEQLHSIELMVDAGYTREEAVEALRVSLLDPEV